MPDSQTFVCPKCKVATKVYKKDAKHLLKEKMGPVALNATAGLAAKALEAEFPVLLPAVYVANVVFLLEGAYHYFFIRCGNEKCHHHFFVRRWED